MVSTVRLRIKLKRQLKLGLSYEFKKLDVDLICFNIAIDLYPIKMAFFEYTNYFKFSSY